MKVLERYGRVRNWERDGKIVPYKKGGVDIQVVHVFCWESEDPTKKMFDLIIGIFGPPPGTKPPEQGHFVGDCFW